MWKFASGIFNFSIVAVLFASFFLVENSTNISEAKIHSDGSTRIEVNERGHFLTTAKLNGHEIEVFVDTGATSVMINKSIARKIGLQLSDSDFKYKIHSANGPIFAAATVIKNVQLGGVSVENLQAAVLPNSALSFVVLGYDFLGQISSFEESPRELVLIQ